MAPPARGPGVPSAPRPWERGFARARSRALARRPEQPAAAAILSGGAACGRGGGASAEGSTIPPSPGTPQFGSSPASCVSHSCACSLDPSLSGLLSRPGRPPPISAPNVEQGSQACEAPRAARGTGPSGARGQSQQRLGAGAPSSTNGCCSPRPAGIWICGRVFITTGAPRGIPCDRSTTLLYDMQACPSASHGQPMHVEATEVSLRTAEVGGEGACAPPAAADSHGGRVRRPTTRRAANARSAPSIRLLPSQGDAERRSLPEASLGLWGAAGPRCAVAGGGARRGLVVGASARQHVSAPPAARRPPRARAFPSLLPPPPHACRALHTWQRPCARPSTRAATPQRAQRRDRGPRRRRLGLRGHRQQQQRRRQQQQRQRQRRRPRGPAAAAAAPAARRLRRGRRQLRRRAAQHGHEPAPGVAGVCGLRRRRRGPARRPFGRRGRLAVCVVSRGGPVWWLPAPPAVVRGPGLAAVGAAAGGRDGGGLLLRPRPLAARADAAARRAAPRPGLVPRALFGEPPALRRSRLGPSRRGAAPPFLSPPPANQPLETRRCLKGRKGMRARVAAPAPPFV
jgi:hypothetical protein